MRLESQTLGIMLALVAFLGLPFSLPGQTGGQQPVPRSQHEHAPSGVERETAKPLPQVQGAEGQLRLEDLEQMALESNPTLAQAAANVRVAIGRKHQSGLYPNPTMGATGDEVSPGPIIRGGEFGAFVEQRIVTAGKLGLSRRIFEQEELQAEATASAQRYRVLNSVRSLYYEALGAQRRLEVQTRLGALTREAVKISKELSNVGAADQPDILESEIEAEQAELGLEMARTALERTWRELAAVIGRPSLQPVPLAGNLDEVPKLDFEKAIAALFGESPEIKSSELTVAREEATLRRAKVEKTPDIVARGGLRYNRELLEVGGRPVGLEGFFDVGLEIPFFNRNQGNIAAAKANLERARRDVERVKLSLRLRMARAYKQYQDSLTRVEKYRTQMIPRAQKAYDLYLTSFRQMAAAYPQVLIAQRNLFQLQGDYVSDLITTWQSAVEITGLLLTGGLEAPGGMEMAPAERMESADSMPER
jgi:cobalt-zinc-cadmium efflux system outer membrane protein